MNAHLYVFFVVFLLHGKFATKMKKTSIALRRRLMPSDAHACILTSPSKQLGHTDVKTTHIYAKVLDKNKQAAVAKISDVLKS